MTTKAAPVSAATAKEQLLAKCPGAQLSEGGLLLFVVTSDSPRRPCLYLGTGTDPDKAWVNAYEKTVLGLAVPFG